MPQDPSFWLDTRIYLAVAAALLLVIVFYNPYLAVLGAILLYALYLYGRERHRQGKMALTAYLETMTHHVDQATYYALQNIPLAIAIVDSKGVLHWRNSVLADWAGGEISPGESLLRIWPDLPLSKIWGKSGADMLRNGERHYQIIYKPLQDMTANGESLQLLYLTDITSSESVREQCYSAMPVLAHVQIDNYDDVLHGLTEGQRTALLSEVNQRLLEWVASLDGFVKKYSEDLYLIVLNHQALNKLLQDKFDILDRIRAIRGGNKIPVTISIGMAADEWSNAALGQRAQACLDLALGRGGDQAAVHIQGKMQFYGGKAKAVEKNTRVKARIVSQAIRDIMEDAQTVLIMGHMREDFDSLGAAMGVAKMARFLGKTTYIVVSQPSVSVGKLSELLEEYEEYRNIFITPAQGALIANRRTLLVVVDTHRPELTAAPELLHTGERVIVIDHHRRSESFIANPLLVYLEPSASSTSELVTELLTYFDEKLDLTRLEASALYAGIVVDTKNFAVQTGVRTFEAASFLRRGGADPTLVRHLFRMDFATLKARADIINSTEILPGGVAIAICPPGTRNAQIVAAQSADMLLNTEGTRVVFVLFAAGSDSVGVSARSQGDINVQVLLEQLGGGGHQTMAGAQIKQATIEDVKAQIIEIINNYIEESE